MSKQNNSKCDAGVAQLVERILGRDEVTGSSPVIGSNKIEFTITLNIFN
ncbi:protein of unknown function [Tenacibaculum jejuense]|uniref:Uncharacterized protein n=1 Tax=Tenacibaculum jejuense TaxID=584609 RepID=A0A238U723_9FLAO|nr:protein of unknown function [Tenacibaculum jejuense]